MAHGFLTRTSTRLPGRGKALVKVSMVDENGFSYEYAELEVDMALARESIAQLYLHSGVGPRASAASAPEPAETEKPTRRRRRA